MYWLLARDNGQGFGKGFLTLDLFLTCVLHATPWCLCLKCVVDLLILPGLHDEHIGSLKIVDRFGSGVSKKKRTPHLWGPPWEPGISWKERIFRTPPPSKHPKGEKKKIDKKSLLVLNMVAPWNAKEDTTDLQPAIVRCFSSLLMGSKKKPWNCETCKSSNDLGPGLSQCSN